MSSPDFTELRLSKKLADGAAARVGAAGSWEHGARQAAQKANQEADRAEAEA